MAGYNYGYHRKKMEEEFEKIAAVCRAEGIAEDTIGTIHRILLDELNSNRKFYTHTQSYDGLQFPDGEKADEGQSPLLKNYLDKFSVTQGEISEWGRYGWIEDIELPELAIWVRSLDEGDILLLTLMVVNQMKQTEIARLLGKHDSAISRKMRKFRESLTKILPEWLKREYIK